MARLVAAHATRAGLALERVARCNHPVAGARAVPVPAEPVKAEPIAIRASTARRSPRAAQAARTPVALQQAAVRRPVALQQAAVRRPVALQQAVLRRAASRIRGACRTPAAWVVQADIREIRRK